MELRQDAIGDHYEWCVGATLVFTKHGIKSKIEIKRETGIGSSGTAKKKKRMLFITYLAIVIRLNAKDRL